ncbi:hypothetical protein [Chitinophaga ginsengisoli]|uniref:DUF4199 domain-containing protein n=1 Tax=Chitinophaga ginsengisoli TaxID=363837 RepID=A0A2P8FRU9_9BACT|nr:hypothetical protein [Chitinophaga ginsengisoli]PSL24427.1 hypothetical protein CLV42_11513 [Chitinophaga ginsengisoli]
MNKENFWFYSGLITFSLVLGLMIGASNSPVIGALVTGVIGAGMAFLGLFFDRKKEDLKDINIPRPSAGAIGKAVTLFSVLLCVGVYLGVLYRNFEPTASSSKFVWENQNAPSTAYEAIDWILVKENLIKRGFTEQQVKALYNIRIAERNANKATQSNDSYSEAMPYYKMLQTVAIAEKKTNRGPASE